MHPQRAPHSADPVEQPDEVRVALQQLGELVDHNEKRRQRLQVGAALTVLLVLGHAGQRPGRADLNSGLAQQVLPAVEFAGQHLTHAADKLGFLRHVGDDGGRMRKVFHAKKCRTALEVGRAGGSPGPDGASPPATG